MDAGEPMDEGEPMDVQVDGDAPQPPPDMGRQGVQRGQASSSSTAPVALSHRGPGTVANVVSSSGNGPGPDQGPDGIGILAPGRQQQQDGVREIPGWATQGPRSHSKPSPDQPPFLVPAVQRGVQDEQHANMDAMRREAEEARRQMAEARSELDLARQQVPMVLQHVGHEIRAHVNSLEQRLAEALESRGPAAQSQGVPSNAFAAPPQGVFSNLFAGPAQQPQPEIRFRPPQPGAEDVEVSQNKRPGDDDAPPGQRQKVVSKEDARAKRAQEEEEEMQQLGQIWPHQNTGTLMHAKNMMKVMTAHGDTAIDRAMGRFFTDSEFMKGMKKQAEEEGKSLHDMQDKWVKQLFAWMQPSGAPEPTLPPPEPAPSEAPATKTKKTRQASRSRSAAQEPAPSEAPAAEEEKARPSRGRPKWKPKPSEAPRTQSETAKPKPSRAPRRREESIETVPSASVPPTSRLQPEEEGGPKPKTRARLGKTAKALKETQQAKKARIMEIEMDNRIQEAKKRGRQAARSAPPMPVILPTADDQEAVYKFNPAVVAQARQELEAARQRSASVKKGKKEATPSPAPKQTVKKPRANSGSTAPHRTTLPVNALLTGHGKPKAKGRPRKTPLETIPETPAPVKKGRGRPKKVVVVDNRLVVPSPILPYNDVGNDPYLIKSH